MASYVEVNRYSVLVRREDRRKKEYDGEDASASGN